MTLLSICFISLDMKHKILASHLKKRGAISDLARRIKVTRATVCNWIYLRIPAERVLEIEKHTGIPRTLLRPDIYPH